MSYNMLTSALKRLGVEFIEAMAGVFVFARLGDCVRGHFDIDGELVTKEDVIVKKLREAGVLVTPGSSFHLGPNKMCKHEGWVRIVFAVEEKSLLEGIQRIEVALSSKVGGRAQKEN